jgi:hypothetical protein
MTQPPEKECIGFLSKAQSKLKKMVPGIGYQREKLVDTQHPVLIIPAMGQITVVMGKTQHCKSATANQLFHMAERFLQAGRETLREEEIKTRKFVEELE